MPKRSKLESSSFGKQPCTTNNSSGVISRIPFSDITNVRNPDTNKEAKERRRQRKIYLDSRKNQSLRRHSNALKNVSSAYMCFIFNDSLQVFIPNLTQDESKERRKLRKLYIDGKRYGTQKGTSQSIHVIASTSGSSSIPHDMVNVTTEASIGYGVFDPRLLQNHCKERRRLRKLYLDSNLSCLTNNMTTPINIRRFSLSSNITNSSNTPTILQSSSLQRMSPGKRKLLSKPRVTTPIPMIDLTTEETTDDAIYKGVSTDYFDHGDQCITCEVCNAKLWDAEKGRGRKEKGRICYFLCCGYGKVELPDYKDAVPSYKKLFTYKDKESKHFLNNIRRYNSMFAFTSMGGKVDHTVNRDSENQLVKAYRMVRDCFHENPDLNLKLRLIGIREKDGRTYNLPTCCEVAALIVWDIANTINNRDIVIETQTGTLKRISELHPSYLALQYPILFPYGDDGYRIDIPHRGVVDVINKKRPNCTMREFFAYRVQDRINQFSLILNSRRLFQQFLVDAYTMIESERLNYIRLQQKNLRSGSYESLCELRNKGQQDISKVGKRIFLPSSFTGGARYMMQNYLDAMAICKWFGYPDFFITITCNPKWPEVKRFLRDTNLKPEDRPDILTRLFKIKLDSICKDFKERHLFGKVAAVVYTIEFQKRGLPHAHLCLFLENESKLPMVDHVDPFITAEIPDEDEDAELYALVKDYMIHGPCGNANLSCPCMVDNKCSKGFPKNFQDHTTLDSNGFPIYKRRDNGAYVVKNGIDLDNRSVVPYNKKLLKRYQAHINVEWCNQAGSIKYLFKYINKGPDRATVAVVQHDNNNEQLEQDEVKEYYDCRYISACEASWRIFAYDVHYRTPSVMRLPFHLPGKQHVVFGPDEDINQVLNKPFVKASMFLSWMERNKDPNDTLARTLTYVQFPSWYVWKLDKRCWEPRQRHKSIGRIHAVSPSLGEAYYLRILLNKVKGPKSFDDIKTVDGKVYDTFRDACYALGLLDDDAEYIEAIKEANETGSPSYLRNLFATLLLTNTLSRPEVVWESTWRYMTDDFIYRLRKYHRLTALSIPDHQLKNYVLSEVEKFLARNNSSLKRFETMSYPDTASMSDSDNRLINEERIYDQTNLQVEFNNQLNLLTEEQRSVFQQIINAIEGNKGGVFFVYGYGGTGKTFLWKTLSAAIRSKGQIVLNVASSGIASLLLSGGRTAHSRFRIPLNLTEDSVCHIKPNGDVARLLHETNLIIWDEAPMVHKHAFEALDRTMNDIFNIETSNRSNIRFGGKVIVLGGDFRQILPVVPNGGRQEIVNASISSSYLWNTCKLLRLTKNMRLTVGSSASDAEEIKQFAKWLLDIGEGNVGGPNDGEASIEIPSDLLITDTSDPISTLIDFVYPSILENFNNQNYFSERAIFAPKNEVVHEINDRLLSLFPGEEREYLSSDSLCQSENPNATQQKLYSPDVLNGLKVSGLPNHRLALKVGVPVMLLRNIDQQNGLCNGTRLQIKKMYNRVIEAEIISGGNIGTRTYIPRISLIPSDKKIPFEFQRRQFPLAVCFAMTINKSQGQSLSRVFLYLKQPVFTHGQLYVALSRVKTRQGVKLLILDNDGKPTNKTTNVVYKEVFHDL
ncbi:uncharacterized protein LOC110914228 [Helianthus annuus]|uniref:uncharacterized protein LOC110914228 n=1 Tax=Helianthus annuus TaxID=4232 RepID=UPI000B8FB071|nr:uncharacterized protein LOC110914228 [Helianthus annuus]